ncbi:MAG: hypothetical protein FWE45_01605 [Firmicutes bacterium]|nr:hypothetical protein [Bacillota bacterium]
MKTITNKKYNGEDKPSGRMPMAVPLLSVVGLFSVMIFGIFLVYTVIGFAQPQRIHNVSVHISGAGEADIVLRIPNGESFEYSFLEMIEKAWNEKQVIISVPTDMAFVGWYTDTERRTRYDGEAILGNMSLFARFAVIG